MSKHPIDKIFEEKLKDFEKMPRAAVWDKLSAELDQKAPVPWWKRKAVWWSSGISVTLLSIGLALWQPPSTPLSVQTAARMVSLHTKLAGVSAMRLEARNLATKQTPTTQDKDVSEKTSTNNKADNSTQQTLVIAQVKPVRQKQTGNFAQSKHRKKTRLQPLVNKKATTYKVATPTSRKVFSTFEFALIAQNKGSGSLPPKELKGHLPTPKVLPKITVTLKLSENMAAERSQDEPDKGLKKIWKKLKGLDNDGVKSKKKKKKSKIFKFLGDRD